MIQDLTTVDRGCSTSLRRSVHLLYHQRSCIQKILLSQACTVCWGNTGESAAGAAPRLAVRQLEGRIIADSAASYVDLGRRASIPTHTHRVELTARQPPVDWSLCHHDYRMSIPQPADSYVVIWDATPVVAAMPTPWNARVRPPTRMSIHRSGGRTLV